MLALLRRSTRRYERASGNGRTSRRGVCLLHVCARYCLRRTWGSRGAGKAEYNQRPDSSSSEEGSACVVRSGGLG
jgi:hypothetical protein